MIFDSDIDKEEWPHVAHCATYLINCSPSRSNYEMKTPFELFYGRKPDVSNLRIFGCVAWQHIDEPICRRQAGLAKLDPRTVENSFVGYIRLTVIC